LHPPLLDEAGLAAAVRWYTEGFSQRSGIDVKVTFPSNSQRIPNHVEIVLFRLLQESLTNAHRHSGASIVNIALENKIEEVMLEVHDNGQGIAPELLSRLQKKNSNAGVGVAGMWERINDLNGQMQIASSPSGTTFRFTVPLASVQHRVRATQSEEADGLRISAA
jgi:signal transduction histidine kinase